jgi:hypothetical protein
MIHFIDKVLENLRPYVPLFQSCVWPTFLGLVLWCFRRPIASCVETVQKRIEAGSSLKAGPIEIGEDLQHLDYATPRSPSSHAVMPEPADWVTERNNIYKDNSGLFLTHVLTPSRKSDQEYDIFIYLIRHKTTDISDIQKTEFFFGHMWGNEVFTEIPKDGMVGIATSAYGPFLCVCRVHLLNGQIIKLHRYIDFEMGKLMLPSRKRGRGAKWFSSTES